MRDSSIRGRARCAFVTGAVDGGHTIPVAVAGLHRRITKSRGEQKIRGQQLAPSALLLTPIDAITSQIVFQIDGPGEVDLERARRSAREDSGDEVLRGGGRENVAGSDNDGNRVTGFERIVLRDDDAADGVDIGLAKIEGSVAIAVLERRGEQDERRDPFRLGKIF